MHCTINGQQKFLHCTIAKLISLTLWQPPDFSLLPNQVAPASCAKARVSWSALGIRKTGARPNGLRGRGEVPGAKKFLWAVAACMACAFARTCGSGAFKRGACGQGQEALERQRDRGG